MSERGRERGRKLIINNVIIEKDDAAAAVFAHAYILHGTVLTGTLCYWPLFTLKTQVMVQLKGPGLL